MLARKFTVNHVYLILVVTILYSAKMLIPCFIMVDLFSYVMGYSLPFPIHRSDTTTLIIIFFVISLLWIFLKKATYSKSDLLKLSKNINIKLVKSKFFPKWFNDFSHTFLQGILDRTVVAAIMDYPSNIFILSIYGMDSPFERYMKLEKQLFDSFQNEISTPKAPPQNNPLQPSGALKNIAFKKAFSLEFLYEESRIELFSLVKGPFNIDIKIKVENDERNIPTTDCPEIDRILKTSLSDVKHFYARLIFSKDCLRMTIIGGSWEGEKFRQKIIKGFEIFQSMNNELRKKYPVGSWDNWDVKWDKKGSFFYLAPKERQQ